MIFHTQKKKNKIALKNIELYKSMKRAQIGKAYF